MSFTEISTPCVRICVVDPLTALCIGCGRSTSEIADWLDMSETERTAIMAGLGERMRAVRGRRLRTRERGR
jgi:predicted Fe-S protein YdhL (DUF1289 family)